jgi:hypothetical protein
MPKWPPDIVKAVHSDVRYALTFKVGRSRRPITDGERDLVADAIVEHLQLANWHIKRGQPWGGFAYLGQGPTSGSSEK